MNPAISVVMPVWNGENFLAEAVDSILAQSFSDFELIVVDDGSTDRTLEILDGYRDPRLQVHRLAHSGIVVALNHGVAQARARWIARQDADDYSFPERFAAQWRAISGDSRAVLCFTNVELFGAVPANHRQARFPRTSSLLALRMCFQCPIVHSTVMFQKDAFLAIGGYRAEERHAEDFAAWGRLLEAGHFIGLAEPLVKLRLHGGSASQQNLATQLALTEKIAVRHCERFMNLNPDEAGRAHEVLSKSPKKLRWSDWWWFLSQCAPRLRSQSLEVWIWLGMQTLKRALGVS